LFVSSDFIGTKFTRERIGSLGMNGTKCRKLMLYKNPAPVAGPREEKMKEERPLREAFREGEDQQRLAGEP
jgi:hypothetical protein